jgi:hypothetical protein
MSPPPIFFLPKNSFLLPINLKKENFKKLGGSGGKGCIYIKEWFKPIFPSL